MITVESDGRAKKVRVLLRSTRGGNYARMANCKCEVKEGLLFEWNDPSKALSIALV